MAERKDLRLRRCSYGSPLCSMVGCLVEVSDAELLDLLLPDIDWDALREAIETLTDGPLLREMTRHNAEAFAEAVAMMAGPARRLLALHDGSTNE